ncbi:MAG: hypothetical protein ACR2IA_10165 [Pyrinomonadaceae bacterium]
MIDRFANLTRGEIARKFISRRQKERLEEFFGRGVAGANNRLAKFYVPNDLTQTALEAYREIARRTITEKLDKNGVQALRLQLVEKALVRIK